MAAAIGQGHARRPAVGLRVEDLDRGEGVEAAVTRPPSYYTPTGTRDGEGDDHTGGGVSGSVC